MADSIYDHDINEAHELLDKLAPGTSGFDQSIPERLIILSERLEALEEIRQRVADGWTAISDVQGVQYWSDQEGEPQQMSDEVAAVLWPSTEDDTSG